MSLILRIDNLLDLTGPSPRRQNAKRVPGRVYESMHDEGFWKYLISDSGYLITDSGNPEKVIK